MFGIRFIKFQPHIYVLKYKKGRIVREGRGLSFTYFAPTTSLVAVPMVSTECPFMFEEVTADFQEVTIQGQVSYRISESKKIAGLLNYTLGADGKGYVSDDPEKLFQRIINIARVEIKKEIEKLPLRESLRTSEALAQKINSSLGENSEIGSLGIEILGLSILAIKPNPETARALEAKTREQILKESDDAIYTRRNASVEQERKIKENELNTEIAVENKKKEIKETQLESERLVQQKRQELKDEEMNFNIGMEQKKKELVASITENARAEADSKAYSIAVVMKALEDTGPEVLKALTTIGMKPEKLIAMAFQDIAGNAEKIGQLNISPELLNSLLGKATVRRSGA